MAAGDNTNEDKELLKLKLEIIKRTILLKDKEIVVEQEKTRQKDKEIVVEQEKQDKKK
ncbi:unnamed protein product, partial [Rotaria magnacalcarata]